MMCTTPFEALICVPVILALLTMVVLLTTVMLSFWPSSVFSVTPFVRAALSTVPLTTWYSSTDCSSLMLAGSRR